MTNDLENLNVRAKALRLHGLLAHWADVAAADWVKRLIEWEEQERTRRSLERRIQDAHIGRFKPLCDFDWAWPKRCDRTTIEAIMSLDFLNDATNVVLVGGNGLGKSTIAKNIAHQALTAATPFCSPRPANCSVALPHSTAIPPCTDACVNMRRHVCW